MKKRVSATRRWRLCRNPGLNQGPLDLQSNALPTELFRLTDVEHLTSAIGANSVQGGKITKSSVFPVVDPRRGHICLSN